MIWWDMALAEAYLPSDGRWRHPSQERRSHRKTFQPLGHFRVQSSDQAELVPERVVGPVKCSTENPPKNTWASGRASSNVMTMFDKTRICKVEPQRRRSQAAIAFLIL